MKKTQIGELLPDITAKFQNAFDKCIRQNSHRREPYYILATADWYSNNTKMRIVVSPRDKCPPMMLNTMCWQVNNKTGEIKELWVLPKDAPIQADFEPDGVNESIIQKARHFPIIYS